MIGQRGAVLESSMAGRAAWARERRPAAFNGQPAPAGVGGERALPSVVPRAVHPHSGTVAWMFRGRLCNALRPRLVDWLGGGNGRRPTRASAVAQENHHTSHALPRFGRCICDGRETES